VLLVPVVIFLVILINNILGLFPYVFTSSRHLVFTLCIGFPLWSGHIIIGWVKSSDSIFAHLVPLGTPVGLIVFIVLIEIIRNFIRPLTLSVRLAANIIAGHLLLNLLGSQAASNNLIFIVVISVLVLLIRLEIGVAVIQAYVFSVLRTLYFNEVIGKEVVF